jgi:hypothetical protein
MLASSFASGLLDAAEFEKVSPRLHTADAAKRASLPLASVLTFALVVVSLY